MAQLATTPKAQPVIRSGARPSGRVLALAGLILAAALLTALTLVFTHVDTGLSRHSLVMCYLAAVAVASAVGGRFTAWAGVGAAAVLVNFFFTRPLYQFTPWDADNLVFLGTAGGVAALAVVATRTLRRGDDDVTAALDAVFREHTAHGWSAVYITDDGQEYAIWAPHQTPAETAQQLADGVHGINCAGCTKCQLAA